MMRPTSCDSDASRAQLDSVRSEIEDKTLGQKYLGIAVGQAGANVNIAVREAAEATIKDQSPKLKDAADSLDAALLDVLKYGAAVNAAGEAMAQAAQSVSDTNPGRYRTSLLVSDSIRQVADGKLDVPFALLVASRIPEVL